MISSSFRHLASRSKSSLPQRALDALRSGNVDKTKKPVLAPNKPAPVAADTMVGNTKISTLPKPNAPDAVYPKPNPNAGIFKTPTNPAAAPIEATLSNIIKPSEPSLILPPAPSLNVNAFQDFAPRISVIGVGGAGGNAVNNMIARNLNGCDFLAINTDAQHLSTTLTDQRLQIGREVTQGLGCGANPDAGRMAAEESADEIMEKIGDAHMVFITAGMGGGTGTGAAAVVADLCYKAGILTVGVVTKVSQNASECSAERVQCSALAPFLSLSPLYFLPAYANTPQPFRFEGTHRMRLADEGIEKLSGCVDTMIVIPNQVRRSPLCSHMCVDACGCVWLTHIPIHKPAEPFPDGGPDDLAHGRVLDGGRRSPRWSEVHHRPHDQPRLDQP